jgi:mycothiol synthase
MTSEPATGINYREIDLRNATDGEYAAASDFFDLLRLESRPDDPPVPSEERIVRWRNIPSFVGVRFWIAEEESGAAAGALVVQWDARGENPHVAQIGLDVRPDARRRGIGTRLLAMAVEEVERLERRLMIFATTDRVPAGEQCMRLLGAEAGLQVRISQLDLSELPRDLVQQWISRAPERAGGYSVAFWDGPFPQERLEAVAELFNVMNTAPREKLDVEDQTMTAEQLREMDQQIFASGQQRWVAYAVHDATGELAGFTELTWHPRRPQHLNQGNTGVFPAHREHGLGRWLKATVLDRVLRELPEARFVRTGNAESNAAMLGINEALGFKPYSGDTVWQVSTEKVRDYLVSRGVL